jgi:hypothetical protein
MDGPSLQQVQRWMKAKIAPAPSDTAADGLSACLNEQGGAPGIERLSVYAGGYLTRTEEALAEVYEAVRHVVGKAAFAELATAYARRYPSDDYNLTFRGRRLPEFLATSVLTPLQTQCVTGLTERLPFLPDLAQLEWLICRAFHAREQPPLDVARLSSLPLEAWEHARLSLQPSVAFLASAWPVRDIWEARKQPRETIAIDVVNRPQRVLVYRQGLAVQCALVEEAESALLEGVLARRPLGELCELLAAQGVEQDRVSTWCARWMRRGVFVEVTET